MKCKKLPKTLFLYALVLLSSFFLLFTLEFPFASLETVGASAVKGDLVISEDSTIENCEYHIIGNITVEENATLIIKNALFNQTFYGISAITPPIVVKDNAKLILINSTVTISSPRETPNPAKILVSDNAFINISNCVISDPECRVWVWMQDNATGYIENSVLKGPGDCEVILLGRSKAEIRTLVFDRIVLRNEASVQIDNSTITGGFRTFDNCDVYASNCEISYVTADGPLTLHIRDSSINSSITASGNSKIWLLHSSADKLYIDNSTIWLIGSSIGTITVSNSARILVGWELPLIGIVAFPMESLTWIKMCLLVTCAISVIIVIYVIIRSRRGEARKDEAISPS